MTTQPSGSRQVLAGLAAAILFLLLPYTVDAVLFLTNLGDLMVLAALLASLLLLRRYARSGSIATLLGLFTCALVAAGSKETGLILLPLTLLFVFRDGFRRPSRRSVIALTAVLVAIAAYLGARFAVLDSGNPFSVKAAFLRFFADYATAIRWGLFPHPLALKEPLVNTPFDIWWWAGLSAIVALAIGTYFLYGKARTALLLAWTWTIAISPSLLGLQYTSTFDPRYLYIPGAAIAVGGGLLFANARPRLRIASAGLAVSLLLLSLIRINAWSDNYSFWQLEHERHPQRVSTLINYGAANEEDGKFSVAQQLYARAAELASHNKDGYYAAYAYYRTGYLLDTVLGQKSEALVYYQNAVRWAPLVKTWIAIGNIHAGDRNYTSALTAYQNAQALEPNNFQVLISLANAQTGLHQFDAAMANMGKARALVAPGDPHMIQVERRVKMIEAYRNRVEGRPPQ